MTPSVLIRCDGSFAIGLGHVRRCLALASALAARGAQVSFAMVAGADLVRQRGFAVWEKDQRADATWFVDDLVRSDIRLLILDSRDDLAPNIVYDLRRRSVIVATIDDPSERRLAADLAFYPPVPQLARLDWTRHVGRRYVGWPWIVLGETVPSSTRILDPPFVLVTMGGSDPLDLSPRVVRALDRLEVDFRGRLAIGPAFRQPERLEALARTTRHPFETASGVSGIGPLLAGCALAVAAFGVTAYELCSSGTPAILLGTSADHAESAGVLAEAGVALSLGVVDDRSDERLPEVAEALLRDPSRRQAMGERGRSLIDGQAADRIADLLLESLKERPR